MVAIANQASGIYGARMTGGGFGGCTINLARAEAVTNFVRQTGGPYYSATGLRPEIHVCEPSEGVGLVS